MGCRGADGAADHAVSLVLLEHHRADRRGAAAHFQRGLLRCDALERHHAVGVQIIAETLAVLGVHYGEVHVHAQAEAFDVVCQHGWTADQDRVGKFVPQG